ncbi:MAG TPA: NADH-quinone oxidoreductase subunit N [Terriglobales bacterium]|nr:NADH-quinone oxidoreductase subunit N [Terriglobales bacterium]
MNTADLLTLLPFLLIAGSSVFVMLAITAWRRHWLSLCITLVGLAAAFGSLWLVAPLAPRRVTSLLILDHYALFYIGLIIAATFAIAILCYGYLQGHSETREELYVLLLVATLGSMVLVASSHFVSFFLGLEILSVSLYALSAYLHNRRRPVEAGIKYLILAGSSSAFLLFGMALIYAQLGTMELPGLAASLAGAQKSPLVLAGLTFIITGIGFKLGVVPFHLWTPDVYEGAPAPVTAFIATVSKGAIFALLLRYFYTVGAQHLRPVFVLFAIIAIASMLIGNLLALLQNNVKRILAYSSIAHMGYLLVAFEAGGSMASEAIAFYLVAYFITTVGAFGVVTVLSDEERDADTLEDYAGLFWRKPVLASIFTLMLLSLAGIPVTAGFLAKFYVVTAGASAGIWALILILVISSVIGLFYYLRIVVTMYVRVREGAAYAEPHAISGSYILVALTILLVWLGVYPVPLLNVIRKVLPM